MKPLTFISAFLLSASLLTAQENKAKETNSVTVRVKKIENINGVEKVSDSTYTINGPFTLDKAEEMGGTPDESKKECKGKKIVIVTDEAQGDNLQIITGEEALDEQVEKALKAAGAASSDLNKVMIVNTEVKAEGKDDKAITKIVVVKKIQITDPSKEDSKLLDKQTGVIDNKLPVDQMKFYPNPNNGKFTLDFNLKDKGNTEVNILNIEGKSIYKEELKNFSGNYTRDIDISSNPKGVYFIRIGQGDHAQLKKVVLE